MSHRAGGLLVWAVLALLAASSRAAPAGAQLPARVAGQFQMSGVVTIAKGVSGEYPGEAVQRAWSFVPLCAAGPCPSVQLVRQRAGGFDTLILNLTAPGSYSGRGLFYAPLRCCRRTWLRGESVPFTITLQITAITTVGDVPLATAIRATYSNPKRRNRTPCVASPGHDAAVYSGQLAL